MPEHVTAMLPSAAVPGGPASETVEASWTSDGTLALRAARPEGAADPGGASLRLDGGQVAALAGLLGGGQVAAYARACLRAARPERDWFRRAVAKLEAAGERIVQSEQPERRGDSWQVLDWRTGQVLACIDGGDDAYEAAWQSGWTDVSWIGRWMEDLATDGTPAADWPEALPPPPDIAELTTAPPPLPLPGLPGNLRIRLEQAIDEWVATVGAECRVAEIARLAGWTEDEVLACVGSYLTMAGDRYMRAGAVMRGGAVTGRSHLAAVLAATGGAFDGHS